MDRGVIDHEVARSTCLLVSSRVALVLYLKIRVSYLQHCADKVLPDRPHSVATFVSGGSQQCVDRMASLLAEIDFHRQALAVVEVSPNAPYHPRLKAADDGKLVILTQLTKLARSDGAVDHHMKGTSEVLTPAARTTPFAGEGTAFPVASENLLDSVAAQQTDLSTGEPLGLVKWEVSAHVFAHDEPNGHDVAVDSAVIALSLIPPLDVSIEHVGNGLWVHTAAFVGA